MKTSFSSQGRSSAGHALLMVMCITAASMVVLAATMNRALSTSTMNARNNQYVAGLYAAEAATEKVFGMMKTDFLAGNLTAITNHLGQYRGAVPSFTENPYWGKFEWSDGQGHVNSNYVACTMSSYQLSTNWGAVGSQASGLYGWTNNYLVLSNVRQANNTQYKITNACQLNVDLALVPIFQFAIFYNGLLEFTWCAPLTVNGRTHANGDIYTGTCNPNRLIFNSPVTTHGTVSSPAWDGHSKGDYTIATTYNAGYSTNWQDLTLPIGTTNVHALIDLPPVGGYTNEALGKQAYYNNADLVLLVTNINASKSSVTLTLKSSPTDPSPTNITAFYYPTNLSTTNYVQVSTNFPFLNVTNTFLDQRENDTVKVIDIDMGVLSGWLGSNVVAKGKFPSTAGVYTLGTVPNILYAADNRSYNSASELTAIRLRNAQTIPANTVNIAGANQPSGLTVATPNPLYVYGNFNCPNNAYLNKTNPPSSSDYPASLVSDALTILSTNWLDSESTKSLSDSSKNKATSTTVNAAILTGVVPSTGSGATTFSGGAMNLPRLLEDWGNGGSVTLTLNTSIVNVFASIYATHQFENPGGYYYAPSRQFSFDMNFLQFAKQPPGTPMLGYVLRDKWAAPPPGPAGITYTGN